MLRTGSAVELIGRFNAPLYALPVDAFRVLTGVVVLAYFVRTFFEAPDFSDVRGLIDHQLSNEIFPFTGIGLFNAGMNLFAFRAVFVFAIVAACGLISGHRSKLWAVCLYVIAVSTYRWNFFVMYVDDVIVHLVLFWMLLLPIGNTLVLGQWLSDRRTAWNRWKSVVVPGAAVRCFAANLALIYLVAGLWKWTSAMWRDGTAVYAILKTPLSYAPEWWGPRHLGVLMLLNYLVLVCEPLFAAFCVLRLPQQIRYATLCALLGFHIFILATMRVPFANAACLAAAVVLVRVDVMRLIHRRDPPFLPAADMKSRRAEIFAVAFVVLLSLAMLSSVTLPDWRLPLSVHQASSPVLHTDNAGVDGLGQYQRMFFSALWAVGVAQQYQLLNWIDDRNFNYRYSVEEISPNGERRQIESTRLFPDSLRSVLLQSNLHGIVWVSVPPKKLSRLRESLKTRFAARYCRLFQPVGRIVIHSSILRTGVEDRIPAATPSLELTFVCKAGVPVFSW